MKKLLSIVLALVMALGLCAIPAWGDDPVTYMNWDTSDNKLVETTLAAGITPEPVANASGNVTWDGTSEKWYIAEGTATISGILTVTGTVHLILKNGCDLTVEGGIKINSGGSLTIYGQANGIGKLTTNGMSLNGRYSNNSCGIYSQGGLTINGGEIAARVAKTTTGGSYGIWTSGSMVVNGGSVTVTGGKSTYSNGICIDGGSSGLLVNGGTVDATGGEALHSSAGIYAYGTLAINGGKVTAAGGKVTADSPQYGSFGVGGEKATLTSGTLVAKGDTTSANGEKVKAMNKAPALPAAYWWRTAETDDFTEFVDETTVYANGTNTYAEITTVNQEATPPADQIEPEPEEEPIASGHTPIRRQHGTAAEDTAETTTDTTIDTTKTEVVTSAKTFDAGVAAYGVMAVMSLTGSAWVMGKKRG